MVFFSRVLRLTLVPLLILFIVPLSNAQGPGTGGTGDPAVPIDGGVSILLASGLLLGGREIVKHRKKSKDQQ
ncbi:hypothetical protein FUAX_41630 (plasmid) [Fulvitalea axinellae]|uniref:VPDSG-CTERM protein sorting domain-containing protein n=2 Tax=Fulvitalea axinellae TaxID=1182444 RepID=A0AAU9CRE7_9BACT|nr:hypothetical protein FUAX_41630 [Fulvitalea axinellae]